MILGLLAAITAMICIAINTYLTSIAGERFGKGKTTFYVLALGLAFNASLYLFVPNSSILNSFHFQLYKTEFILLLISGILGFFVGYCCILLGAKIIGVYLLTLIGSLSVIITYIFENVLFNTPLATINILAALLLMIGIYLTLPLNESRKVMRSRLALGVSIALVFAVTQAISMIILKSVVITTVFSPLEINLVRLLPSVVLASCFVLHRKSRRKRMDTKITVLVFVAAFLGPFLSILLINHSLVYIAAGTSVAISQLSPVIILFIASFIEKTRITTRSAMGCLMATLGALVLVIG